MRLIYVAGPLSSRDPIVQWARCQSAAEYTAGLLRRGIAAVCPAAHSWGLIAAEQFRGRRMANSWAWWRRADLPLLNAATELHVLTLRGWRKSKGVLAEIKFARGMGIPVRFVNPKGK